MAHLQAQQIASYLSKFPIAAELPWSVGAQEIIVLRCQDYNTFVKEQYVLRDGEEGPTYVKQRDYGKIAWSAAELINSEAAYFEKLTWHKAKFYGLSLPNGAARPIKKDWTKEEIEEIKYVAANLRAGAGHTIHKRSEEIMLAARHLNYVLRKKVRAAQLAANPPQEENLQ